MLRRLGGLYRRYAAAHPGGAGPRRLAGFALRMLRLAPVLARWALTGDPGLRPRVKRGLGLDGPPPFPPLAAGMLAGIGPGGGAAGSGQAAGPAGPSRPSAPLTLLIPVHNGFDVVPDCLARVLANTDLPWRAVLVEDGSTDPRIRPLLRGWAGRARAAGHEVLLIEHGTARGFVGAANAGLAAAGVAEGVTLPAPLVLLNSDALLPPLWASRLLAPLSDPGVASVTPMSNDGELTSVPFPCRATPLPPGAAAAMDAVARRLDPCAATAPLPTGTGFCLALSPAFLARLPRFDPAFGRGYGEEVDWCQKARALGGRNLGTAALFVEHRGGASFGAEKPALVARHGALIAARHPRFDAEVQAALARDPLGTPRLALALARAGALSAGPVPVYLGHSLGGGAEIWLRRRLAADLRCGLRPVVLRVGGAARWQVELHDPAGVTGGTAGTAEPVRDLLHLLPECRITYSCGVGDADPLEIPDFLLGLKRHADSLEVLFHDYLPISPACTLLGSDGRWHGPPGPDSADPAHAARRPDGSLVPLRLWQAAWGRLLRAAGRITLFSEDGPRHVAAVWPDLPPGKLRVRPHGLPGLAALAVPDPPRGGPPVLGIPGNLNAAKGALVAAALARRIDGRILGGVVALGRIDPAIPLPRRLKVHGGYAVPEIPALARRYGITHWLIPSLCPETFSYATHEALATGLPVLAFDLGAQGLAVRAAPNGIPLPHDPAADPASAVLAALAPRRPPRPFMEPADVPA